VCSARYSLARIAVQAAGGIPYPSSSTLFTDACKSAIAVSVSTVAKARMQKM
jgi:hypothetical protein